MADDDTNWRNPRRVALNVAVFYTGSCFTVDDRGTVAKAVDTLDRYNIELRVGRKAGRRGGNLLSDLKAPIPHEKSAYEALRQRVNQMLRGCPFSAAMPAVFTQFERPGYGITPAWFKLVTPGCLIGPTGNDDKMDLVHEIGHGAGCDHVYGDGNRDNFMHEANGRSTIARPQVEKLARAPFAVGLASAPRTGARKLRGSQSMRIFSALRRLMAGGNRSERRREEAWLSDPLMHPDVLEMTARQIADLPFDRSTRRRAEGK